MALRSKIKNRRKQLGLTYQKLGELSNSSKSYIWEIENGKDECNISAEKLFLIAKALGCQMEYLLSDAIKEDSIFQNFFFAGSDEDKQLIASLIFRLQAKGGA